MNHMFSALVMGQKQVEYTYFPPLPLLKRIIAYKRTSH